MFGCFLLVSCRAWRHIERKVCESSSKCRVIYTWISYSLWIDHKQKSCGINALSQSWSCWDTVFLVINIQCVLLNTSGLKQLSWNCSNGDFNFYGNDDNAVLRCMIGLKKKKAELVTFSSPTNLSCSSQILKLWTQDAASDGQNKNQARTAVTLLICLNDFYHLHTKLCLKCFIWIFVCIWSLVQSPKDWTDIRKFTS